VSNAVTAFLDDRAAAGEGARTAIATAFGSITYDVLLERACRTGNALRALGVEPEQRVAMLLHDGLDWAATFFGALRIGAVAVPLNTRLAPARVEELLHDSRAKVLVTDVALADPLGVTARLPHLRAVLSPEDLAARIQDAPARLRPEPASADDMAVWLYTSGTSGTPKAAVHTHGNLLACRHYGIDVLGVDGSDRMFATSKLFFAYALGNALLIPCFTGAQSFLHAAWPDPERAAAIVTSFRPTLLFSVPTFYAHLLRADLPADTFRSVRVAVSAGERLPEEIYGRFRDRFGVEILDGIGATETIFIVLSNRPGRSRAGSSGTPVPGTEARLVDGDGRDVTGAMPGMLHVKTPSASARYWNRSDASRRAFLGEWFRTGDVYTRDGEGFYYHRGREDDLFKVAGMWVSPADVEAALRAHPEVADVGVVGAEDAAGLVKPFAFVVPRTHGGDGAELLAGLRALAARALPTHQQPRKIVLVDALPRTATGTLQRLALREIAVDGG
jgi:benzoate-CoA ligase family protein